jgi:hypothetical protein
VGDDEQPRDAADPGGVREAREDAALVERLRDDVDGARERVREAWARYQRRQRGPDLPAIAGSPLLPALMALVQ